MYNPLGPFNLRAICRIFPIPRCKFQQTNRYRSSKDEPTCPTESELTELLEVTETVDIPDLVPDTPKTKKSRSPVERPMKPSSKILKHFIASGDEEVVRSFPLKLTGRQHSKAPLDLYIASKNTARNIVEHLKPYLKMDVPLVEVNPGLGVLTKELLKANTGKLIVFEPNVDFTKSIEVEFWKFDGKAVSNYYLLFFNSRKSLERTPEKLHIKRKTFRAFGSM